MPRRLGQHFLRKPSVARLLRTIDPQGEDDFLEIGPGRGALTWPLGERCRSLVAIELDAALATALTAQAPPHVTILQANALDLDWRPLLARGGRLVGNLPYYISSPLVRKLLELRGIARDAHVMVQDEVARRIASPPGSKDYGILSALTSVHCDVERVLSFGPGAFEPPPRVSSAVLRLRFLASPRVAIPDLLEFEGFLQKCFARRRRTLENNLADSYANLKQHLRLLDIQGSRRAETLSVVELGDLFRALTRQA